VTRLCRGLKFTILTVRLMSCDHILKGTDRMTGTVFRGRTVFNLTKPSHVMSSEIQAKYYYPLTKIHPLIILPIRLIKKLEDELINFYCL
jgi:hypothetical protein